MNNFSLLLLKAHEDASALVAVIGELRSDDKYKMLYLRPQTVAKVLDITPHKSRTLKNEEHYRLNVFLPFIDHMLRHFNERFPQQLMPALLSWHIIPANVHALTSNHVESMSWSTNMIFLLSRHLIRQFTGGRHSASPTGK